MSKALASLNGRGGTAEAVTERQPFFENPEKSDICAGKPDKPSQPCYRMIAPQRGSQEIKFAYDPPRGKISLLPKKDEIFCEKVLDKWSGGWYDIGACVGKLCMHCDDAGDCVFDGNFRGVCPVIGRLNCFLCACVYRLAGKKGRPRSAIFHDLE